MTVIGSKLIKLEVPNLRTPYEIISSLKHSIKIVLLFYCVNSNLDPFLKHPHNIMLKFQYSYNFENIFLVQVESWQELEIEDSLNRSIV